jgi:hypothetical protein
MKPVDAEENPGLAKLPTEVRNKMGYIKKGGLMKKPRRFEAGGEVEDDRTSKDQDIGDDVRARARKFLETGKKDEEAETPKAKSSSKPKAAAPKAASSSSSDDEKVEGSTSYNEGKSSKVTTYRDRPFTERLKREAKDAAEEIGTRIKNTTPEDAAMAAATLLTRGRAMNMDRRVNKGRSAEGVGPSEALSRREAANRAEKEATAKRSDTAKEAIKAKSDRTESSGAMKGDFKTNEIRKGFKAGGKVSSASSRGDGCAIRGKTRA